MLPARTAAEWEVVIGENIKRLRLLKNLSRQTVAVRSGVSERTLANLESGKGSSIHTLIVILRTLGQEEWFESLAPIATINPMTMPKSNATRQRASKSRK